MSKSGQVDQIRDAISYGSLGFGVLATVAPKAFAGIYGLRRHDAQLLTMIRLWGSAVTGLGVISLVAKDDTTRRAVIATATAMNVVNTVAVAAAGSDVPARARVLGAATSAGFAAASGYVLTQS